MNTFIQKIAGSETTLLILEDKNGYKFGGFCTEEWHIGRQFYGTGENFVYTFKKTDQCEMWLATGDNEMY